jgi:H-type lectin domain
MGKRVRRVIFGVTAALGVAAIAHLPFSREAKARDLTTTQVGTFQLQVIVQGGRYWWQAPNAILFPTEFASPPKVIVSFSSLAAAAVGITATNVTNKGFTPVLSPSGPILQGREPLTVSWVAVETYAESAVSRASPTP